MYAVARSGAAKDATRMLDSLRVFFGELAGGGQQSRFAENDYRLAAAALLVHASAIDGNVAPVERAKLHTVLKYRFELDDAATDELIAAASVMEGEAVDLYHFTRLLNRSLDEEGRRRIVEMMWEIAYADGKVDEFEDNLIWRVADLLGVSSRERVELRHAVAEGQSRPGGTD
jgi:uncharacterized tellurite resistance protein B-like protein